MAAVGNRHGNINFTNLGREFQLIQILMSLVFDQFVSIVNKGDLVVFYLQTLECNNAMCPRVPVTWSVVTTP